ncbi:MAG: hypothetical protein KIS79_01010 [Burkholderiales bacterium]|nr:hypothetical protein [Burkholderiales bacterium]
MQTRRLLLLALLVSVSGCATFRGYDEELRATLTRAGTGDVEGAIRTLERNNRGDDKDLLYYLERGELERLGARYDLSNDAWLHATERVNGWETAAATNPARLGGTLAAYTLNDKLLPYEGHDYEKVMLTTRIALNHLARGNWDDARVAIRQTHEREAVIAQARAREYERIREQAEQQGARIGLKDINGYPVETIDNPEVNALRNGYQSAISHYLAGFVYEALGEPSLAAAGYRQAIELRPDTPLLEQALAGLDERVAAPDDGSSEVLFLIETGLAPARVSRQFSLPIPIDRRLVLVSVSFPVLHTPLAPFLPAALQVDGQTWPVAEVTSIDTMARRALQDEMPGIMLRGFIRSTGKAVAQYQAQRQADLRRRRGDGSGGAALDVAAIALMIGSMTTESADERAWRSLPANVLIARGKLPRGLHHVTLPTPAGGRGVAVNIEGRYAFIGLRLIGDHLFPMLPEAPATQRAPGHLPASLPREALLAPRTEHAG